MEPDKNLWLVVIITFSTLITAQSECVPFTRSCIAESLTPIFNPLNPSEKGSESPATSPEHPLEKYSPSSAPTKNNAPSTAPTANPPTDESSAESINPQTETESSDLTSSLRSGSESSDVKSVCDRTDFPPLCEAAVNPLLKLKGLKPDPVSILQISIQAVIDGTKAAMTAVNKLRDSDCKELYEEAMSNLDEASNAVRSRDFDTVNSMISAALTDYSTCNDAFDESGETNPLADLGDRLMKLASNCLAVTTQLKK